MTWARFFALLAVVTLIGGFTCGCAGGPPPSKPIPAGRTVAAPPQWADFCVRHPEDPQCPR